MVKFGLTAGALRSYVPLITDEVMAFINRSPVFKGSQGVFNVAGTMAEMTIYTASGSLQGKEVRNKFDSSFADLYHDLDMGFSPINFMLPWAPLPHNKKRDYAQRTMAQVYLDIIRARRQPGVKKDSDDMIWNLMSCRYKDGSEIPDTEIAHMMIALLMAGQHSSSATIAWVILRLASRPDITEELYAEQRAVLGSDLPPLTYDTLQRLPLHAQVVKETLRLHAPIHSIMRKVKTPIQTPDSPYTIPTSHVLLSAPGVTSKTAAHFPDPALWEPHRWDAGSPLNVVGNPFDAAEEEKVDYGYGMVSKGASSPYLPFGAGRHRCIGESFAYVQLGTITVAMVRMFRFRNVEGAAAFCGTDYSSLFSRPINPAIVRWERRTEETGGDDGEKR
jgi:cytochrome P450